MCKELQYTEENNSDHISLDLSRTLGCFSNESPKMSACLKSTKANNCINTTVSKNGIDILYALVNKPPKK